MLDPEHYSRLAAEGFILYFTDFRPLKNGLSDALKVIIDAYENGGKLLTAGCGGSAADAEHFTAELLKSFRVKRAVASDFKERYISSYGEDQIINSLEGGLPAFCLSGNFPIMTAILNDQGGELVFAQQAYSLVNKGDVFFAISTSGNSEVILSAARVARLKGASVIALTGRNGGKLKDLADVSIIVPDKETYLIQEKHIQIIHFLSSAVEKYFYAN
jgi:Phosphoheptose isomerase